MKRRLLSPAAILLLATVVLGMVWFSHVREDGSLPIAATGTSQNHGKTDVATPGVGGGKPSTAAAVQPREESLMTGLHGKVVLAETGVPAPEAEVEALLPKPGACARTKSNKQGEFLLEGLSPNAKYLLNALDRQNGLVCLDPPSVVIVPGQKQADVVLKLAPAASVSGKALIEKKDLPLEAAEITCVRLEDGIGELPWANSHTDERGAYVLSCLTLGRYRISCQPPPNRAVSKRTANAGPITKDISLESQQTMTGVDFTFEAGVTLAGQVVSTGGIPIVGARLRATNPSVDRSTDTGPDGRYELTGIPPENEYNVTAVASGYAMEGKAVLISASGNREANFRLSNEATVCGRVVDDKRVPLPGLQVRLNADDTEKNWYITRFTTRTDETGSFLFESVPAGSYYFSLEFVANDTSPRSAENASRPDTRFTVSPGQNLEGLEIVVQIRGQFIEGKVINEQGQSVENVRIEAHKAEGAEDYSSTRTDATGAFRLEGFQSALLDVSFDHPDYATTSFRCPAGTSDLAVVLLRGGVMSGTVIDGATDRPIAGARVEMVTLYSDPNTQVSAIHDGVVLAATTDDNGRYTIDFLPAGQAMVRARADGYVEETLSDIPIQNAAQTGEVNFKLWGAGKLEGQVVLGSLETQNPSVAIVATHSEAEGGKPTAGTKVEHDMHYTLDLQAGVNRVRATAQVPIGAVQTSLLRQEVEVFIQPGETAYHDFVFGGDAGVKGVVSLLQGEVRCQVYLLEAGVPIPSENEDIIRAANWAFREGSNATGRFELLGVPAGNYNLVALTAGADSSATPVRRTVQPITVRPGKMLEVNVVP